MDDQRIEKVIQRLLDLERWRREMTPLVAQIPILQEEMGHVRRTVKTTYDAAEEAKDIASHARKDSRTALDSTSELEGKFMRELSALSTKMVTIDTLNTETKAQSKLLVEIMTGIKLGKWVIGALAIGVPALWWLFLHLAH